MSAKTKTQKETLAARFDQLDRVALTEDVQFVKSGSMGTVVRSTHVHGRWWVELDVLPGVLIPESSCVRA
jgi:hypothetical protein